MKISNRFVNLYEHYKNLHAVDFVRMILFKFTLLIFISKLYLLIKSLFYFKTTKIELGRNVSIFGLPNKISIGNNCKIFNNCILEFSDSSNLNIGSNVILSYGVVLCCNLYIQIGNDVQVGEYTSIRDTTHSYNDLNAPIKYQKDISMPIIIHDNVWIGRGCIIMPGTIIQSGVIVGANSVINGILKENSIYFGAPAKFKRMRV